MVFFIDGFADGYQDGLCRRSESLGLAGGWWADDFGCWCAGEAAILTAVAEYIFCFADEALRFCQRVAASSSLSLLAISSGI